MENLNNILNSFSLSEAESALYEAALKLPKAGISEIAKKSGMGRTVAYFHIKNMIGKGILRQTSRGKKMIISPIPPAALAETLQKKVNDFKTLVPQLEMLGTIENQLPEVEILESSEAFKKIYDEVINMPIGASWKVIEDKKGAEAEMGLLDNSYWAKFFSQMAQRKIMTKAIFTNELLANATKMVTPQNYSLVTKRPWNIRTLPEEIIPIKNLVLLYNKKLSFLFPEISLTITIKHPALFGLVDSLFETIFHFAKKTTDPWGIDKLTYSLPERKMEYPED